MMRFLRFGALGAALVYFFDPQNGARRRNTTRDRLLSLFRRGGRQAASAGQAVAAEAQGVQQKVTHLREEEKDYDDQTLKAKIESEVFRGEGMSPREQVNVNVENGVVYLRGEVDEQSLIDELVGQVEKVQGVNRVESLLHTPGTPAPMKQD